MSTISASTTTTTAYKVTADTTGTLVLQTGSTPTTAVTIDTSQNMGLGVTPSAWRSTNPAFQVGQTASLFAYSSSNIAGLGNNFFINSAGDEKYITTATAGLFRINGNSHQWFNAASGTAGNTITFTQAMTLDASGNLLLGTTASPTSSAKIKIATATRTAAFFDLTATGGENWIIDSTNTSGSTDVLGIYAYGATGMYLTDTGNLLVGSTTATSAGRISVTTATDGNGVGINSLKSVNTNYYMMNFKANGTSVGDIYSNGSTTTYGTSSDYRLKENIAPMTGALTKVAQLKPCTYTWKNTGLDGQGFIAHELQEVVPDCVGGEKDGTKIEQYEISPAIPATFDDEGNELTPAVEAVMGEREVPVYQSIDTSFLVATLTAAIQEQQAIIETLTNRITALEAK